MKSNSQCFLKTKLAFDLDYLRAFTCTLQTHPREVSALNNWEKNSSKNSIFKYSI